MSYTMYSNVTAHQHADIIKEILALRSEINEAKCVTIELSNKVDRGVNFEKSTNFSSKEHVTFAQDSLSTLMSNEMLNAEILRNDYSQLSSKFLQQILEDINNQMNSASS